MTAMIKSGTYRLVETVKNPCADKRHTHDWRMKPEWTAGSEFLVVDRNGFTGDLDGVDPATMAIVKERAKYTVVQLVGDRHAGIHEISPDDDEQYALLLEKLVPIAESPSAMFTRLHVVDNSFAEWLVTSGQMTAEQFEKLWHSYQESD